MSTEKTPPTFKVKLLKDGHTHAGKPCAAGDFITVTAPERQFLVDADLIAKGDDGTKAKPTNVEGK